MNNRVMLGALAGLSLVLASVPVLAQGSATKPTVVQVKLSEWTMGLGAMKVKGPVQFEVVNAGKFPHALAIAGKIGDQAFEVSTGWLKAGEKTTLSLNLPSGTYATSCPVPGHEEEGMKSDLTFE